MIGIFLYFIVFLGLAICISKADTKCPSGDHIKPETVPDYITPSANFRNKQYNMTCQGLTKIPDDIPYEALEIRIRGNPITTLRAFDFNASTQCIYLALGWNEIVDIEIDSFYGLGATEKLFLHDNKLNKLMKGMFNGLPSLQILALFNNYIKTIDPGALAAMPALREVTLGGNALKMLSMNIFSDDPSKAKHPENMKMTLNDNPLICNCSLCEVKQAEEDGWLTWWGGDSYACYAPECTNFARIPWVDVDLGCHYGKRKLF